MQKEKNRRLPLSRTLDDTTPREVFRAHVIADTIRALRHHGALEIIQNDTRDAVAEELGVPALWLDAAQETGTVTLEALHEWREWEASVMRPFVERGKKAVA